MAQPFESIPGLLFYGTAASVGEGRFGDITVPPQIASYGYSLYQPIEAGAQAQMSSFLSAYVPGGLPAAQQAVSRLSNLAGEAFGTLDDLSKGNVGQAIGDATPLLAAAMAAASVNPIVGACVLVGASILSAILPNLGASQECDYRVGDVCFHTRARAAGPQDPAWLTLEAFDPLQNGSAARGSFGGTSWESAQGTSLRATHWTAAAFASWWPLVGLELYALGDRSLPAATWAESQQAYEYGSPDATAKKLYLDPNAALLAQLGDTGRRLLVAFDKGFVKMQEPLLNGFAAIPTPVMVNALTLPWGVNGQVGGYGAPAHQFTASSAIDNDHLGSDTSKSATFLEWVLAGGYDGQRIFPGPAVNVGPRNVGSCSLFGKCGVFPFCYECGRLPVAHPPASSSSTLAKVAAVGTVATGLAAVGVGVFAYLKGYTFGKAMDAIVEKVKRPFAAPTRSTRRRAS